MFNPQTGHSKLYNPYLGYSRDTGKIGHDVKFCNNVSFSMSLPPTEAANTQSTRAEYNYYSALIQTKKAEFFTAKYFRLCYFKSFCLIFTKLYVLSYCTRISPAALID